MSDFESDTAVRKEDGHWIADLQPRWNVGNNPNGGYLLAIAVRAMREEAGKPDPVSVTAHYLSPPEDGPVAITANVIKPGRNFVTVVAEVKQGERERVRVIGAFGDLSQREGPTRISAKPPDIPPPDECVSLVHLTRQAGRKIPEVMNRFDLRLPPDSPWGRRGSGTSGEMSGTSEETGGDPFEITGWIRLRDGTDPSELSAVAFADAFPPTLLGTAAAGWVPTIELTVHLRGRPSPGWLLGSFKTRILVDGLLEEDGELWDSEGRPVALSRQLALVLPA